MTEEFRKITIEQSLSILENLKSKYNLKNTDIARGLGINNTYVGWLFNGNYDKLSRTSINALSSLVNHIIEFRDGKFVRMGEIPKTINETQPKEDNKEKEFWELLGLLFNKKPESVEINIRIL